MIYDKFVSAVKKHRMLPPGERVLLALSGGADSTALLLLFLKQKKELNLDIRAIHINHNLRPRQAGCDEEFVKKLCKKHKVKLFVENADVFALMEKKKLSLENAGREARYKYFEKICAENKITKIALAHTKDDQAETYLMRILRGAGLKGLSGIWPVRKHGDVVLIRPLLDVSREEITLFLKQNRQAYRVDSSNRKTDYLRNKIRLRLIPYLRKNFNPQLRDVLSRQANTLRLSYLCINKKAKRVYDKLCTGQGQAIKIDLKKFRKLDEAVAFEVLRLCLLKIKGNLNDISFETLMSLWQISQSKTGSQSVTITDKITGFREYSVLRIEKTTTGSAEQRSKIKRKSRKKIEVPGVTAVKELNCEIRTRILPNRELSVKNKDSSLEYIDLDKVKHALTLRTRKAKDKFKPLGLKTGKSLKKFFIDLKVPLSQRNSVPVVLDAKKIVWVAGYRISHEYRLSRRTCRVLELKITYR